MKKIFFSLLFLTTINTAHLFCTKPVSAPSREFQVVLNIFKELAQKINIENILNEENVKLEKEETQKKEYREINVYIDTVFERSIIRIKTELQDNMTKRTAKTHFEECAKRNIDNMINNLLSQLVQPKLEKERVRLLEDYKNRCDDARESEDLIKNWQNWKDLV